MITVDDAGGARRRYRSRRRPIARNPRGDAVDDAGHVRAEPSQGQLFALAKPSGIIVSSVSQPSADLARQHGVRAVFLSWTSIRRIWRVWQRCSMRGS